MGSIEGDQVMDLLGLAQQHHIALSVNEGKLRMAQTVEEDNPDLEIVFRTLAKHKDNIMAVMADGDAIRQWLDEKQRQLIALHDEISEGTEKWLQLETMHFALHPDDRRCICESGQCRDYALVRCGVCANTKEEGD
jgi:chromosome segregation ATPase